MHVMNHHWSAMKQRRARMGSRSTTSRRKPKARAPLHALFRQLFQPADRFGARLGARRLAGAVARLPDVVLVLVIHVHKPAPVFRRLHLRGMIDVASIHQEPLETLAD